MERRLQHPKDRAREIENCERSGDFCALHHGQQWPCNDSSVRYTAAALARRDKEVMAAALLNYRDAVRDNTPGNDAWPFSTVISDIPEWVRTFSPADELYKEETG